MVAFDSSHNKVGYTTNTRVDIYEMVRAPLASPEKTVGPSLTKFGTDALPGKQFWAIEAIFEI